MDQIDFRLLNDFQRDFPLAARPFAAIGERLGLAEEAVLKRLRRLLTFGAVSRVGAVFAPGRVGASALAAMAVPPARLDAVADLVSARPEVNHNYEREHRFNLWFVACAADEARLAQTFAEIEADTGLPVLRLPLVADYHIDLGFDLKDEKSSPSPLWKRGAQGGFEHASAFLSQKGIHPSSFCLHPSDRPLLAALQDGLPLTPRPYAEVARRAGIVENEVMTRIGDWLRDGTIKRLAVVVRHRPLGYTANAMVVFDLPENIVDIAGQTIACFRFVTLCYRRPRRMPDWPYNLFCMIHGRNRDEVLRQVAELRKSCYLELYPYAVLFSTQAFKQRGARYVDVREAAHG